MGVGWYPVCRLGDTGLGKGKERRHLMTTPELRLDLLQRKDGWKVGVAGVEGPCLGKKVCLVRGVTRVVYKVRKDGDTKTGVLKKRSLREGRGEGKRFRMVGSSETTSVRGLTLE